MTPVKEDKRLLQTQGFDLSWIPAQWSPHQFTELFIGCKPSPCVWGTPSGTFESQCGFHLHTPLLKSSLNISFQWAAIAGKKRWILFLLWFPLAFSSNLAFSVWLLLGVCQSVFVPVTALIPKSTVSLPPRFRSALQEAVSPLTCTASMALIPDCAVNPLPNAKKSLMPTHLKSWERFPVLSFLQW